MPLNFEVEKYKCGTSIFVETGTFRGDGVNKALTLGYDKIYSIELDKKRYKPLAQKFEDDDEVILIQGNSEEKFPELMDKINKRCTIFLDAHYCGDDGEKADKWSPIREELNYLKTHPIKNHTIILGDWACQNNTHFDKKSGIETGYLGQDNTIKKIKKINKDYKFALEYGSIKDDILIAYIDEYEQTSNEQLNNETETENVKV